MTLKEGGLQPSSNSSINMSTVIKDSTANEISSRIINANNVPTEYLDMVKNHVTNIVKNPIEMNGEFEHSQIELFKIDIGNFKTAAVVVRSSTSLFDNNDNSGRIRWNFSGKNTLRSVTLRVGERMWQEEFARLRSPISSLLPDKNNLKTTAHQIIYEELCTILTPVEKSTLGNTVILQGASGLGKTYCVQHYFYHESAQQHQMVAWLSGATEKAFLRGWSAVAQQLRNVQVGSIDASDNAIIQDWCENKLGQWLLIIDEVDIDAAWLAECLPRKGGHVIITTHRPQYQLHQEQGQVTLHFLPLSREDSQLLLQMYVGPYWQASGHPEEQKALDYLAEVLGGFPVALTQMALLAHKKSLSFRRLAEQFKQPMHRIYLLNDAVYDQLRNRTFIDTVRKGQQQLLSYLLAKYPKISEELHHQQLRQFVDFLCEQLLVSETVSHDCVQKYWRAICISHKIDIFSVDELTNWLVCLPLSYNNETQQWCLSLVGKTALSYESQQELQPALNSTFFEKIQKNEMSVIAKIPESINISMSMQQAILKDVEIAILTESNISEFKSWQLPTINTHFISRPQLIESLKQKLPITKKIESSTQLFLTAAVTGMGGIGKTELARHFITDDKLSSHYQRRFWLTAINDSQLRIEFRQLAAYLGLIDFKEYIKDDDLIHHVHTWLSINSGWLMVLDNADNYNSIEKWIPKEGGAVLVTTREQNPGVLSQMQTVSVDLLEESEAVQWLYQLSNRSSENLSEEEKNVAKNLVEKLGLLPLAIAQAAAYLKAQPKVSIADYLADFMNLLSDTTLARQKNIPGSDADSRLIIANTWTISLSAIEKYANDHGMPNMTESLLILCSYLASKDIPIVLLEHVLKNLTHEEDSNLVSYMLDEYIGQLIRYSLVERSNNANTISIHRLIQDIFRAKQTTEDKELDLKNMSSTSDLLIISKGGLDTSLERLLLPHVESLYRYGKIQCDFSENNKKERAEENLAMMPRTLGVLYNTFCLTNEGIDFSQTLLSITIRCYGEDDIETAYAQQSLAIFLDQCGNYLQAENLYDQALAIKKIYSFNEPDNIQYKISLAITQHNSAVTLQSLGFYPESKLYLQDALSVESLDYNNTVSICVAEMQHSLSETLRVLGDYEGAKLQCEKALLRKKSYYMDVAHFKVAETECSLAIILNALGLCADAEILFRTALEKIVTHYGFSHIRVADALNNLALILDSLKQYDEAKKTYKEVLEKKLKYYKVSTHISVAETQQNLAVTLKSLHDYEGAKQLYEEALSSKKKYYSDDSHISIAGTQHNLATVLSLLQKYSEAERLFDEVLLTRKNKFGPTHFFVAETEYNYAILLMRQERFSSSLELIFQCENTFKKVAAGEQYIEKCLELKEEIADRALKAQQYEDAISCFENLSHEYPECLDYYHDVACAYYLLGLKIGRNSCFDQVKIFFQRSLNIQELVSTQVKYASYLQAHQHYSEAVVYLDKALANDIIASDDWLSYSSCESSVLSSNMVDNIMTDDEININNPKILAYYLKIECLLKLQNSSRKTIVTCRNDFAEYLCKFKSDNIDCFLPAYDWLLDNAREMINQSSVMHLQRFFRVHIAEKNSNQSKAKLHA